MKRLPAFRDLSIRTKLSIIMLAVSLPVLLSVSATLLVYDVHLARQQMNGELGALAQLLGDRSSAALVFDDRQLAHDNLTALRGLPHIAAACLYGEDRALFAMYVRESSGSKCSASTPGAEDISPQDWMQVSRNVLLEERPIGRVVVVASPQVVDEHIGQRLISGAFVLVLAVFMTAGLGFWMQRVIARPIERVTAVAAAIETSGDAQLRAPVPGQDEIGRLALAFNAMLDTLQQQHRQQLESEARFRTLVEQAGDAIFLHDSRGRFIDANQQACRSLGYTREELLNMSVSDIEAEVTPESAQAIWNSMQAGVPLTVEGVHRRKNGRMFPVEVRVGLFETNGQQFSLAIVRDISERRQAEAELQRHRDHLEELVEVRTTALEAANRELEAFSYSVSHDLRAPLRAIHGFASALSEDYADHLDETARDFLRRIHTGTQRMDRLIDDLLQLSRVGRTTFTPVAVDLSAMAVEIVSDLRAGTPDRQVDVAISPALSAQGDVQLLHVVLTNLLGNAWKYTGQRATAQIHFDSVIQNGEQVFRVRDNGAGFDMQFAARLFGAFQRLHGAEFPGTGIGLATVQRIVHRHGGRVWAEAEVGKGAVFFFTLAARDSIG